MITISLPAGDYSNFMVNADFRNKQVRVELKGEVNLTNAFANTYNIESLEIIGGELSSINQFAMHSTVKRITFENCTFLTNKHEEVVNYCYLLESFKILASKSHSKPYFISSFTGCTMLNDKVIEMFPMSLANNISLVPTNTSTNILKYIVRDYDSIIEFPNDIYPF